MFDYQPTIPQLYIPSNFPKPRSHVKLELISKPIEELLANNNKPSQDEKSPFNDDEKDEEENQENVELILNDDSLLNDEYVPRNPRHEGRFAYKQRNVYKSLMRHMFGFMRNHRVLVTTQLQEKGYTAQEIEHAYYKINLYTDLESASGNPKKSHTILKKIIKRKSTYSYILKLSLEYMLSKLDNPDIIKIASFNKEIYKQTILKFLGEVNKILD